MGAFGLYLIKVSVCLVLFYLFFKVFMSRETFFRFNRFVLLGGIVVCTLLPFLRLELKGEPTFVQGQFLQLEAVLLQPEEAELLFGGEVMPAVAGNMATVYPDIVTVGEVEAGTWERVKPYLFTGFYIAGGVAVLFSLFMAYVKMIGIIRGNRKVAWDGYTVVLSGAPVCPFCWGKYIVIPENDFENHFNEILMHERMHVMKHHTLDLLIMEGFIVLFWFNPAVWLLKKELQEVHEYEADNGVLNQGIDATKYQLLLVRKAAGARLYSIANSFNHSKLKNRITMMLKEKSSQWARLKVLLFILPTALLMLAFARPETAFGETGDVSESKVIQISEENQSQAQIVAEKVKADTVKKGRFITYSTTGSRKEGEAGSAASTDVVVYTRSSRNGKPDSSSHIIVTSVQKNGKNVYRIQESMTPPPPPSPLIWLKYTDQSGQEHFLTAFGEEQFDKKLNEQIEHFNRQAEVTLQVNRQRNDELQNRIIGLLKDKGVQGEVTVKKGEPAPPLAPLQMAFVYNSGQTMLKDVWKVSNGKSFIDYTPANQVKEVILTITPKCKDEMKQAIRNYLTEKGFTHISEKQLDYN